MTTLHEYFKNEKSEKLDDIRLKNVKLYKEDLTVEIYMESDEQVPQTERAYIRELFSSALEMHVQSIRLVFSLSKPIPFNANRMKEYIKSIKAEWSERGLSLCALALENIVYLPPRELALQAMSSFELRIMQAKGADRLAQQWFEENTGIKFEVNLTLNDERLNQKIDSHRTEMQKEIASTISTRMKAVPVNKPQKGESIIIADDEPVYGKGFTGQPVRMSEIEEGMGVIIVCGEIFSVSFRETKTGKTIVSFELTDKTTSIKAKLFADNKTVEAVKSAVVVGKGVRARGEYIYDTYSKEMVFNVKGLYRHSFARRMDNSDEKRIELHAHTVMSSYDGMIEPEALVERADSWGHKAIAITDHGVLQANPDAFAKAAKIGDFKVIFGCEGYLIDDIGGVFKGIKGSIDREYVAVDIETTGLDKKNDTIIEIGAVRMKNGEVTERFDVLINPERHIPYEITQLTGITNDMVAGQPTIDAALKQFKEFAGNDILVAHNASFDMDFIHINAARIGMKISNRYLDTLFLSRTILTQIKKHTLDKVAQYLSINQIAHHRADDDALVCGHILNKIFEMLKEKGMSTFEQLNAYFSTEYENKLKSYHIVILAKNKDGMINLNKIVSAAHLEHYYKRPRIPRSLLNKHRESLIIGSACDSGELYEAVLENFDERSLDEIANFYDYLEIQPVGNSMHLVDEGKVRDTEGLRSINRSIVALAKKHGKPFVATGDVHFMEPEDDIFRSIIMSAKGFDDADNQAPLYFKTTDEMMQEFAYLGKKDCHSAVIDNPNEIAELTEKYQLMPDHLVAPILDGAKEEITETSWTKAHEIYGDTLPELVEKRINKELNAIISNGYQVLYLAAKRLVNKSNEDGYPVGSRGSVGASYVAYLTGITEVNALEAHYLCNNCKHVDFDVPVHACAVDLEDRICPKCAIKMEKIGLDMPFEVFLGFKGDKVPDIDLNFSGDYQTKIHKYTETLFGKENVFKAGTISKIQDKTAYGIVKKYLEERGKQVCSAEMNRLVLGCSGIKRTTGQHPGGMVVCPPTRSIYEFTALQRPADNDSSDVVTTHYDFNFIHDTLVKLDLLGHDGPTLLKMLCDLSGVDLKDVPAGDARTMSLFSSSKELAILNGELQMDVGTLGIPEYNTPFLRGILLKIKPTKFEQLISINGLSHGEGIWIGNGLDLIDSGTVKFDDVVATREQIMFSLINWGLEPKMSFDVMESVRKGKGMKPEWEEAMRAHSVPEWFIESCHKIKYLFPKPHAAAYAQMSYRIAYFKLYFPLAFYATYFSVKASDFDGDLAVRGGDEILKKFMEVKEAGKEASQKDQSMQPHLETAYEMYCRGFVFYPVDIARSDATKYIIEENGIRIPFSGLQGVGTMAAEAIMKARNEMMFTSLDDLKKRGGATKSIIEAMQKHGALASLPETAQISLFG